MQVITQVPWQCLAGVWYRESFSVTPPTTRGGPWQFDPVPTVNVLLGLLKKHTTLSPDLTTAFIAKGVNDFLAGGIFAGCWLQQKVDSRLTQKGPDEVVKEALWGYNGRAYGSADASPYVMNGFDKDHYPMRLRGTIPDGHGGRETIDTMDDRPGAYVVYLQLKALFP